MSTPNLPGETKRPLFWPLSIDEVKYVGDPLAVVVARDKYTLEDALELVDVEYDPLDIVLDPSAPSSLTRRVSIPTGATMCSTISIFLPAIPMRPLPRRTWSSRNAFGAPHRRPAHGDAGLPGHV